MKGEENKSSGQKRFEREKGLNRAQRQKQKQKATEAQRQQNVTYKETGKQSLFWTLVPGWGHKGVKQRHICSH